MDLVVGQKYKDPYGEAARTILKIDGDLVTYRIDGVLSFAPFRAKTRDFIAWASGANPLTTQTIMPEGMTLEIWSSAVKLLNGWESGDLECGSSDLAIALFELYRGAR